MRRHIGDENRQTKQNVKLLPYQTALPHVQMNNSPESAGHPAPQSPTSNMGEVIAELRKLLAIPPAERPPEWQSDLGPLIGALGGDFSRQENPEVALVQITLVSLAAQKGSKDAKKRALKPTRWISSAPPSVSDLFHDIDEARSSVRVLQPLRTDWLEGYVCSELSKNKWPALTASFVDWLLKTTPTVEAFLQALNRIAQQSGAIHETWITTVLENATKILAKSSLPAGVGIMAEAAEFALRLDSYAPGSSATSIAATKQKTRSALLTLISQASSLEPSVLVQGAAVAAISSLCPPSGAKKDSAPLELEILCRRTISLLAVLMPSADQTHRAHYCEIWSAYRKRLPKADQWLKNSARETPILNLLQSSQEDQAAPQDLGVTAGLEPVLCELVVNWDDYYAHQSGDPAVQQLSTRIDELIRQLGVARFGDVGQIVAFDPIQHYLHDTSSVPPSKVTIIKPGIVLKRSDGSSRVLLMAAVSPFHAP